MSRRPFVRALVAACALAGIVTVAAGSRAQPKEGANRPGAGAPASGGAAAAGAASAPKAAPAKNGNKGEAAAPRGAGKTVPAADTVAIVGATIHVGDGTVIEGGTLVISEGRIAQIGKDVRPGDRARVIDAIGAVVTPGLTDPLTSIGLVEIDLEGSTHDDHQGGDDLVRAGFRAADGYNPASSVVAITRAEGVTAAGVVPTGGLVSGQSAWADLDGATAADALAKAPLAIHVRLDSDPKGGGHATAILRVREAFDDARAFAKRRDAWERNQSRPFAASRLDLEALGLSLRGKVPVVFHVDRASAILAALGVARDFELRAVIAGGAEAWKVAEPLAAAKVPVLVMPLVGEPRSLSSIGARADNAARLHAAGVLVALSTGETHNARKLRQVAGNAVRAGLPYEAAIAAITRAPAEALGMGDRYGTLSPGKVANVVVWSGDPLELSTAPLRVFVRGREVSLRTRQTALFEKYRDAKH